MIKKIPSKAEPLRLFNLEKAYTKIEGHKYIGRDWKVEHKKTSGKLPAEEILDLLEAKIKEIGEDKYTEENTAKMREILKRIKTRTESKEKKLIGWNWGRSFFIKLLNRMRGRGCLTTSQRAEKLLKTLPKIKQATLPAKITDEGLKEFIEKNPGIQRLLIPDCSELTDAGLAILSQYKDSLLHLTLYAEQATPAKKITDKGLMQLHYDNLRLLNLGHLPEVTDATLKHFSQCTTLGKLSIAGVPKITAEGFKHFSNHASFEDLTLAELPRETCAGLEHLSNDGLQVLTLRNLDKFTDENLELLSRFQHLKRLHLDTLPLITCAGLNKHIPTDRLEFLHFSELSGVNFRDFSRPQKVTLWVSFSHGDAATKEKRLRERSSSTRGQ